MSDGAHLTTWVNRETKTRFATVARHQGLSDSALLKRLIDTMLQAGSAANGAATGGRAGRVSRFSIRLRPDDQILLRERAAALQSPLLSTKQEPLLSAKLLSSMDSSRS